jgi:integrase
MTKLTDLGVKNLKPASIPRELPDAGCSGLRLLVHPTGRKSWIMRFRERGKHGKLTLGEFDPAAEAKDEPKIGDPLTVASAHQLCAAVKRKRKLGIDVIAAHKTEKSVRREAIVERGSNLFGSAAREFIDAHVTKNDQRPRRWRETARNLGLDYPTAGGEPTIIQGGLAERWSEKPIAEVTEDNIYQLIREARDDGIPGINRRNRGKSNSRGRAMVLALGTLFRWLKAERRITVNPCKDIDRPAPSRSRDRVLNCKPGVRGADELRWFWAATDKLSEPFGSVLRLLLLTGCRREEIAELTHGELTDDLSMIHLPGSRTKNHLPHDVPLAPMAIEILKGVPRLGRYVFSTNGRSAVSGFSKVKSRLDQLMAIEAAKEGGRIEKPWRVHDLRRTASTGMSGLKIAPHVVEAVLNHVSGAKAGVAGVYNQERYEDEKRAALQAWSDYIEAIVSGKTATVIRPQFRA